MAEYFFQNVKTTKQTRNTEIVLTFGNRPRFQFCCITIPIYTTALAEFQAYFVYFYANEQYLLIVYSNMKHSLYCSMLTT